MAYDRMHDANDKSIRSAREAHYSPVACIGTCLGLVAALMLTGAQLQACPATCNGTCGTQADTDDCAACCGGRMAALACCDANWDKEDSAELMGWCACIAAVRARWPENLPVSGGIDLSEGVAVRELLQD